MMRVAVITNDTLKDEWMAQGMQDGISVSWLTQPGQVPDTECYIDLLFRPERSRIDELTKLSAGADGQPSIILINDVSKYPETLPEKFIRINGWPSFLKRAVAEVAGDDHSARTITEKVLAGFNRKVEWTPDQPGFITARIVTMIINEAYFALGENVSTREDIDIAMKTGTNYPYGPFEWSRLIGLKEIHDLLITLAKKNSRYQPAPLLVKEAMNQ